MPSFPLHERPTRTDKVKFADGSTIDYTPPINTLDPRYNACNEHRVGCDCREADLREDIVDIRTDRDLIRAAITQIIGDHADGCRCHGCQIVALTEYPNFWRSVR